MIDKLKAWFQHKIDKYWIDYYKAKYDKGNICFAELLLNMDINPGCSNRIIEKLENWYTKEDSPNIKKIVKDGIFEFKAEFEICKAN